MLNLLQQIDDIEVRVGPFVHKPTTVANEFKFNETRRNVNLYENEIFEPQRISHAHEVPLSTYARPENMTDEYIMHRDHDKQARAVRLLEGNKQTPVECF